MTQCLHCGAFGSITDEDVTPVTFVPIRDFKAHIAYEEAMQARMARYLVGIMTFQVFCFIALLAIGHVVVTQVP